MTDTEYKQWWPLHLRVASDELLTAEEEIIYQTGLELLEREEADQLSLVDVSLLRSLRSQVQSLEQIQRKLLKESAYLDEKIAMLERTYRQLTGLDLAINTYAVA